MSLALCPQVMSQVPQHFSSSKTQPACDGCFYRQSICSVISFDSGMSRTVHPQDSSKVDVENWHMPVWASHSTFCRLIESVSVSLLIGDGKQLLPRLVGWLIDCFKSSKPPRTDLCVCGKLWPLMFWLYSMEQYVPHHLTFSMKCRTSKQKAFQQYYSSSCSDTKCEVLQCWNCNYMMYNCPLWTSSKFNVVVFL